MTGAGRRRLVAGLLASAALVAGAPAARAQLTGELVPTVAVGATTNAAANLTQAQGAADEFVTFTGLTRGTYTGQRSVHMLALRTAWTKYREGNGPTGLSEQATWLSTFNLTGALDLGLGANAAWLRTSRAGLLDPMTNVPGPQIDNQYVTAGVNQQLAYQPSLRHKYTEALRVSTVHYIQPAAPPATTDFEPPPQLPATSSVGLLLRSEWVRARDLWSLQLDTSETFTSGAQQGTPTNTVLAQALAGWGREMSETWAFTIQAGGQGAFDLYGNGVVGPAFLGTLNYKRLSWYATLTAGQQLSPNIFLGVATVNDQALVRATLPLTRDELLYVVGFGGYTYARLASSATSQRAYDLRAAGLSITKRSERVPFWAALDFAYNDQHGNVDEGGNIPNSQWKSVMLTVGGAFVFGQAAPPIFHGMN